METIYYDGQKLRTMLSKCLNKNNIEWDQIGSMEFKTFKPGEESEGYIDITTVKIVNNNDKPSEESIDYLFWSANNRENLLAITVRMVSNDDKIHLKGSLEDLFRGLIYIRTLDISNFETSKVTDMQYMFNGCNRLKNLNLSNFDTSNVTDMRYMFDGCHWIENLDLSNFDTSNVTDMRYMFYECNSLKNLYIPNFTTSKVKNMSAMFGECHSLENLYIPNFDRTEIISMSNMFYNCNRLKTLKLSAFLIDHDDFYELNMYGMFEGCKSLENLDLSNFDTHCVRDMSRLFYECESLKTLDLSNFDTQYATDMNRMFYGCSNIEILDISSFYTPYVGNMVGMFAYCEKLKDLKLSKLFNTSKVKYMGGMFFECKSLTQLDLSPFDVSKVEDMDELFKGCENLIDLNLYNFNMKSFLRYKDKENSFKIFDECKSLSKLTTHDYWLSETFIKNKINIRDIYGILDDTQDIKNNLIDSLIKKISIYLDEHKLYGVSINNITFKTFTPYPDPETFKNKYRLLYGKEPEVIEIADKEHIILNISSKDTIEPFSICLCAWQFEKY